MLDPAPCRENFDLILEGVGKHFFWNPESPEDVRNGNREVQDFIDNTRARFTTGPVIGYHCGDDEILIPEGRRFVSENDFCNIIFHELGHWTSHRDRLNRTLLEQPRPWGVPPEWGHAMEEIVAELTSMILCTHFELVTETRNQRYVKRVLNLCELSTQDLEKCYGFALKAAGYLLETAARNGKSRGGERS